jgi:hypothetical protein
MNPKIGFSLNYRSAGGIIQKYVILHAMTRSSFCKESVIHQRTKAFLSGIVSDAVWGYGEFNLDIISVLLCDEKM